jgi:hypothetical protein
LAAAVRRVSFSSRASVYISKMRTRLRVDIRDTVGEFICSYMPSDRVFSPFPLLPLLVKNTLNE